MRILLSISVFLIGFCSYAGLVVLDQSGQGDYATFADAFNNSSSGDTIYVVGSAASYGNVSINSPRVIIGNGFFGQSLGYQPSATFGTVTLNAGSATSTLVGVVTGTITFNESNVSFASCYVTGNSTVGASISNISFEKCYFRATLTVQGSGVSIDNSIFHIPSTANALTVTGGVETQLSYVTFYDGNLSLDTAIVNNCIVNSSLVSQTPEVIVDGEFGNKVDVEANLLFTTTGASTDRFFQLQSGSSALTSSSEGAESGAFGFTSGQPELAYRLSGLSDIPYITRLNYSSAANSSTNLDVQVQAIANANINSIAVTIFDNDTQIDAQTFNAFTPASTIDETIAINTSALGTGVYGFLVEVISEVGITSIPTSGSFLQEELVVADANVTDIEYFFDTDPGFGLGTQVVVSPSAEVSIIENLNTAGLSEGFHTLYVRAKDQTGRWGGYQTQTIYIESSIGVGDVVQVESLEYFIDIDPGAGLGTMVSITAGAEVSLIENLALGGLSEGFHTVYLRGKLQDGAWGPYSATTVYVESNVGLDDIVVVEALEYFIDTDPGAGLGTAVPITADAQISLVENLVLGGLSEGFHTVYLRGKLQDGTWGPYSATTVYVESSVGVDDVVVIEEIEYFIDTDPGAGLGTTITIAADTDISLLENVDLSGVTTGFHTLYTRGKLLNGTWGPYSSRSIYVEASGQTAKQITEVEYFFDSDPGVGNGTNVSATLPAASINEMVSLDASGLGTGSHKVSLRAKDETGLWSHYFTQEIEVLAGTLVESVADGNWDDPGIWSTSTVPSSIDSVAIKNAVTLNVLTDTVLALTVTPGGNLDLLGNDVHVRGRFTAQSGSTFNASGGSLFMDGGTQTYSHEGNIVHGNLIFSGSGTKTLDYLPSDNLTVNDSLHVGSGVSLSFTQSPELTLVSNADFVNNGSIFTTEKWSLLLNGNTHFVSGGDFNDVIFQKQVTLNIGSDFNYEGDFTSGGFSSSVNLGINGINLGSSWTFEAGDNFNFTSGGRLEANKSVTFSMVPDVPLLLVNIPSGSFDAVNSLIFAADQLLSIESGDVNLNSTNFSGSGGISMTGGSLNVINNNLIFGSGSVFVNNGGAVSITGTSVIRGVTTADTYTLTNNSGSLTLDGVSISEIGGLGIALLGGSASMNNLSFTNGLGTSYIRIGSDLFDNATYQGMIFESGPTSNVAISDGIVATVTFDNYGGSFGGPDFDNPGTAGTINWTNPQGVGVITVNSPSGGEELNVGDLFEITWTTENVPGTDLIEINLSTDGGASYSIINDGTFDTYNGSFTWTVPDQVGTENVIQVANTTQGISAESNGVFSIVEVLGSITIVTPNDGEELVAGESYEITWSTNNIDGGDPIEISWSQDGGETFEFIDDGTFDTYNGVYNWTVPTSVGTNNQIQITNVSNDVSDLSDGLFSIIEIGGIPVANEASNVTSTSFTASWNGTGTESYFVDVSTEDNFASFVTGYENVATSNTSLEVTGLDFGQSYYYRVRSDDSGTLSDNSNTISVKTIIDTETTADSTALVQIYNALGGPDWTTQVNWETARFRDWDGITPDATRTRVEVVDISGVGAFGDMPNPFTGDAVGGLSAMLELDASNNQITGLMDFSESSINSLDVSGNNLEFDDLETIASIDGVVYSNQASVQFNEADPDQIEIRYTNDYNLSITTGGSANQYQWKRNGENIITNSDFSDNGNNLDILSIDYDNMGEFTAEVTSPLVPGLFISVDPQKVLAIADFTVRVLGEDNQPITEDVFGALLETTRRPKGFDTLEVVNSSSGTFTFSDVVLGNYLTAVASDPEKYIDTYSGDVFQWQDADTIRFRDDSGIDLRIQVVPPPLEGDGTLSVLIEEDFGDDEGRIDARRRAARRKCGLRRKTGGGRTEADDDGFELVAYGETDDNGEFQFGFLPSGTYRFFVEYPGIPLDENAFVEFVVGEAGISDTDFKLEAFVTEDGVQVTIDAVLGVIFKYFKNLQVYPNPSKDVLNVSYRHLTTDALKVELVDLSGAVLLHENLQRGYDRDLTLDVRPFEAGIYLLRFYDTNSRDKNVITYRIVIQD